MRCVRTANKSWKSAISKLYCTATTKSENLAGTGFSYFVQCFRKEKTKKVEWLSRLHGLLS